MKEQPLAKLVGFGKVKDCHLAYWFVVVIVVVVVVVGLDGL